MVPLIDNLARQLVTLSTKEVEKLAKILKDEYGIEPKKLDLLDSNIYKNRSQRRKKKEERWIKRVTKHSRGTL